MMKWSTLNCVSFIFARLLTLQNVVGQINQLNRVLWAKSEEKLGTFSQEIELCEVFAGQIKSSHWELVGYITIFDKQAGGFRGHIACWELMCFIFLTRLL